MFFIPPIPNNMIFFCGFGFHVCDQVLEVRPAIVWSKGKAIKSLLESLGKFSIHLGGVGTHHYKGLHRIMFGCSKWLHYDALLAQLGLVNATYHISFFFFFSITFK